MSSVSARAPLPRVDRELESLLAAAGEPLDLSDAGRARVVSRERAALRNAGRRSDEPLDVSDHFLQRTAGRDRLRVRLYRPRGRTEPLPAVVHFHGGAFIVGDLETEDRDCRETSLASRCAVVSVDYSLAPEHPFPAAVDDGAAALSWAHAHATELGIDGARLAVSGTSAGGCIAAAVALVARDRDGPPLRAMHLIYPALDDRMRTASSQWLETPVLTRVELELMWRHYLGPVDGAGVSAYAAPARERDLAGLPDTYLIVAGSDPLRDEALDFSQRLIAAGVSVELHHYAAAVHGFDRLGESRLGRRAVADRHLALAAALDEQT